MGFDPKKYGAKEVKTSGGIDLSKYGAVEVEMPEEVKKKEPTAGGGAPKPSAFSAPVFGPLAQSVSDPKKVLSVPIAPKGQPKTKYTPEQIKNYGGQVLAETQERLANTGFAPNQSAQLLDDNVLNSVLNEQRDLSAQSFSQRFADLSRFRLASDQQLPKVQLPAGVEAPKQKTFELEAQQVEREFKADVKKRQADLAVMRGIEIAKRNPTESPRVIGTEILKVADPDTYAIWEKTGFANRNIARQAEELGVQALAATGDDNAARLAAEDLSTMDDRFPEQKIAIARQMIAAKAYEDAGKVGALMGKRWTVEEMDKYAQQLPEDYREVYEKHIRPLETRLFGASDNMPTWGLPKFVEGFTGTFDEMGKFVLEKANIRTESDVANEILNAPTETSKSNVGENAALEARKRELQLKKENKQATAADIYELEELTKTTNARGAAQRFLDGAANVTGNVAAFAVMGRALGNALGAAANRAGIMATEVPLGARGLDAIAETATSFGLRKGVLDTAGLLAAGYAASDNSNAKAALQLFPDDKDTDKRTAYKQVMNWANAASELVFRDTKVLDAFKRTVSPKITTFVSQLSKGQIDNLAAKETVKGILREGFQVAKAAGANINQEAVEELLPVVTDAVATGVLAPDKLDVGDKFKEAWDTYMTMLVDGSVVGLVGGVRDYRQNRVALPFMSKLGRVGFEDFTTAIQTEIARQEVQGGLTPEQAQEKRAIIQAFAAANESAATNPALQDKPQREIDKYVALDAKARVLAEKVQTVAEADTVAAEIIAEQVNEAEQAKADLLSDSTVVTEEGGIVPANEAPIEEDLTKISTAESRKAALKEAVRAAFPQTPANEPTTTEANQPTTEIEGATNPQQIEAGTPTGVQPNIGGMGQGRPAGNVAVEGNVSEQIKAIEAKLTNDQWVNSGTVFEGDTFKSNDGGDYSIQAQDDDNGVFLLVRDSDGETIGYASLEKAKNGILTVREVHVDEDKRGSGIGKAMYDYVDANFGAIEKSASQSREGQQLWSSNTKYAEKKVAELTQKTPSQPIPQSQAEPAGNVAVEGNADLLSINIISSSVFKNIDKAKVIADFLPKGGELKSVTEIDVSNDGEEVSYGTKTSKASITVRGLSAKDIEQELDFEKKVLAKSKEDAKNFNEDDIWGMRGLTKKEKENAIKRHKQSLLNNEQVERIVIPFYQKHLDLLQVNKNTEGIGEQKSEREVKVNKNVSVKELDASYKLKAIPENNPMYKQGFRYEAIISFPESLGENGSYSDGNFYKKIPSEKELIADINSTIQYELEQLNEQDYLSGRDERIKDALEKVVKSFNEQSQLRQQIPESGDIKAAGKAAADFIRTLRPPSNTAQSNILGLPIAVYDTAIVAIANAVEAGATVAQAIADVVADLQRQFPNWKEANKFATEVEWAGKMRPFVSQQVAQFPDLTTEEIMEVIAEEAPHLIATPEQEQAVRELVADALGAGNVFAAIDAANTKRSINARNAAKTQVREKYGEEAAKAMDINSNFDKYIAQLKDTGVIEKVIC